MKSNHSFTLVAVVGALAMPLAAFADGGSLTGSVTSFVTGSASSDSQSSSSSSTSSSSTGSTSGSTTSGTSSSTSSSSSTTGTAPTITTQPASAVVNAGATATLTVAASGSGTLRYLWFKNGHDLDRATSATLTLTNVTAADAGVYSVLVANDAGRVRSNAAALTVNVVAGTITTAPQSQTVNAGASATFSVTATGTGLTYQWSHDGRAISDETNASLTVTDAGVLQGGAYAVKVSNSTGIAAIGAASLTVTTDARLTNISTRGHVGSNDDQLIVGFVIRGQGTKSVVLRAVGPTLKTQFNVTDALATPQLTLTGYSQGKVVSDSNTVWGGGMALTQAFAQVGAFPLPASSADSALLETLAGGGYTANITGVNNATGIALAEVYDADTGSPSAELVNISARARVGAEAANTLIAGFAITGTTSDTVLIRGVGPSLGTRFGMRQALGASQVTLFDSKGNQIAVNTNWSAGAHGEDEDADKETDMDGASDRVGAFRLDHGSHDSALLVTLAPGVYTAHVTGVNQSTGIALVEIYEVR